MQKILIDRWNNKKMRSSECNSVWYEQDKNAALLMQERMKIAAISWENNNHTWKSYNKV